MTRSTALAVRSEAPKVSGEFEFSSADFKQIAEMIYEDAGIYLPDAKATLVYSRLAKRLRALGLKSFRQYCEILTSDRSGGERYEMLTALTTNVTNFFREGHHFDHLRTQVLPGLLAAARRGERVRLWSAACSTGQEAYSIALTILPLMPDAASHDVKILATDIDPQVVETARQGRYSSESLKDVSSDIKTKYFSQEAVDGEKLWRVNDSLKSLVSFRELNLIRPWPMKGQFNVIFCRNVVIYFDEPTQQSIWSRFVPKLAPGGWLYIGHSERVSGEASKVLRSAGVTTYHLPLGAIQ